nr:hypothetical protein [Candidatus Cloacimonadota bacterium]
MMKKRALITTIFILFIANMLFGKLVEITENSEKQLFDCTKSDRNSTELQFSLSGYEKEAIVKQGEEYQRISCANEGWFTDAGMPELPRITRMIALPNEGSVSVELINIEEEILSDIIIYPHQPENNIKGTFAKDVNYYTKDELFPQNIIQVGTPAIMRDYRVVNVTVNPFQYNPVKKELRIIKNAEIQITYSGEGGENIKVRERKTSSFFEPLYQSTIVNYEEIERTDDYQHGTYLFIYPNNSSLENELQELLDWKHQKGFIVVAASTAETGTSSSSIKNWIQNAYDTWDNPPEFICLVGDAGGSFSIPTGHYGSGESDYYYTLLEGGDILADAFIGRLSFNSIYEFQTIKNKILNYERTPYMDDTDWYSKALLVGDPSSSGPSCIIVNLYIKEMMQENSINHYFYTEVYSSPFVSQIRDAINSGVSFFNYRGYLGMSGWDNGDTAALYNGFMLPVVVTLTCGTGDFEGTYNCISEYFVKAGSPTTPKGAIASIGTATMDTHTAFNNFLGAFTFSGIFFDKIYNMGGALVRGKLGIYNSFPNNPYNWVTKFSNWNNLMGDPGMELWTDVPMELDVSYDNQVPIGSNYLEITVTTIFGFSIEGAWVTALKGNDEIFVTGYTDHLGKVYLPINAANTGTVNLTVTKHDYIPHLGNFDIVQADYFANILDYIIDDDNSGGSSGNDDGIINPGENIELKVRLKNYGTQDLQSVTGLFSSNNTFVTITDNTEDFGNIQSNSTAYCNDDFDFSVDSACLGGTEIRFNLLIEDGEGHQWNDIIYLTVEGPNLYAKNYSIIDGNNGILDPGETAEMEITIKNIGSVTAFDITGILGCSDENITIIDSIGSFGDILPNNIATNTGDTFEIDADSQVLPGTQVPIRLHLT